MAVAKLAEFVATAAALGGGGGAPAVVAPDQEVPGGDLPLTPIQRWFFGEAFPAPNHYNQSTMLTIAPGVQPDVVKVGSSCSAAHVLVTPRANENILPTTAAHHRHQHLQ